MILGLTGKNASGKGEVARVLVAGGFETFSLSDEIRSELEAIGTEPTRDALIEAGRDLRTRYGLDVLARRASARFTQGLNQVVDSIRNPEEVLFLRTLRDFHLISVDAPVDVRFDRLMKRARPGDPGDLDAFRSAEERELASGNPASQQLEATMAMADFRIMNDGGLDALTVRVKELFREAAQRMSRLPWDEYFMRIAEVVASRSSCAKRRVAAVVVKDHRIISTGYNGTPRGTRNCNENGCPRCMSLVASGADLGECLCSHAEENAIVQASYHGVSLRDATIYSTFQPCILCTKMIINSGIVEVVYRSGYPLPEAARNLFKEAGVLARKG
jgi:dCMP deaminase